MGIGAGVSAILDLEMKRGFVRLCYILIFDDDDDDALMSFQKTSSQMIRFESNRIKLI